ncbi:TniQ protein [Paraburkholderia steynii]|uniref:TniQ protein n=1 Tax=Paraburkholderia steynii TaxID=1245441 RepID=A0A7Z7BJ28_9BURK|nr:TniQ protein [Paraburkholderia steynii]
MAIFLPPLDNGEALFSAVARYGDQMQVTNWKALLQCVFGYAPRLHPAFLQNLDHLASQTEFCWGMSAEQLITGHTLIPYLIHFKDDRTGGGIKRAALGALNEPRLANRHFRTWRKTLRLCSQCVEDDLRADRTPYWRRDHHLPCVLVCERHNTRLREYAYREVWGQRWPTPERLVGLQGLPPLISGAFNPVWRSVAQFAGRLLDSGWTRIQNNSPDSWERILRSHYSLENEAGRADFRWSFEVAFGRNALRAFNVPLSGSCDWLCGRLEGRYRSLAPVVDVLIAVFCRFLQPFDPRLDWPGCVETVSTTGPDHSVGWITLAGNRCHAICCCGTRFSFPMSPRR